MLVDEGGGVGNDDRAHAGDDLGMVVAQRRQGCETWDWKEVVMCPRNIVVRRGSKGQRRHTKQVGTGRRVRIANG